MFEVHDHHIVPQAKAFEILHQISVDDGELTRQIGLDGQVAKTRFNRGVHTHNVGDGGGRRNRDTVGVAHTVNFDFLTQRFPVQGGATVDFNIATASFFQHV